VEALYNNAGRGVEGSMYFDLNGTTLAGRHQESFCAQRPNPLRPILAASSWDHFVMTKNT